MTRNIMCVKYIMTTNKEYHMRYNTYTMTTDKEYHVSYIQNNE